MNESQSRGLAIELVCTDPAHPILPPLHAWAERRRAEGHDLAIVHRLDDLRGGDLLLLVACHEIVRPELRARYRRALVQHASDLPKGRGWSPMVWTVVNGGDVITVSLIEVADAVDTGAVFAQDRVRLEGHELLDEINALYHASVLSLFDRAIAEIDTAEARPQADEEPTWLRRRTPADSRLDPHRPLAEQFDLLRVADPARYPAFFELRGHTYEIEIRKRDVPAKRRS